MSLKNTVILGLGTTLFLSGAYAQTQNTYTQIKHHLIDHDWARVPETEKIEATIEFHQESKTPSSLNMTYQAIEKESHKLVYKIDAACSFSTLFSLVCQGDYQRKNIEFNIYLPQPKKKLIDWSTLLHKKAKRKNRPIVFRGFRAVLKFKDKNDIDVRVTEDFVQY